MEYLTLQDIPHRYFHNPRRMASPEEIRASERNVLPELAAVCRYFPHCRSLFPPTLVPPPAGSSHLPVLEPNSYVGPICQLPTNLLELKIYRMYPRRVMEPAIDPALFTAEPPATFSHSHHTPEKRAVQALADLANKKEHPSDSDPQNHHIRHSPPLQADEQRGMDQSNKLPSFKQVCCSRTPLAP
jgi:hypothetical protein